MSKKFYLKKEAGTCPVGIKVCPRQGCRYYSYVVGCNYWEMLKRNKAKEEKESQHRMDQASRLVRLSDGPVYGKSEG